MFEAILTDEGYRVLTAINGKHGMEVLAEERADLVITGYMMPVMDGAGVTPRDVCRPGLAEHPGRRDEFNDRDGGR